MDCQVGCFPQMRFRSEMIYPCLLIEQDLMDPPASQHMVALYVFGLTKGSQVAVAIPTSSQGAHLNQNPIQESLVSKSPCHDHRFRLPFLPHSICGRVPGRSISFSRDPLSGAMLVKVGYGFNFNWLWLKIEKLVLRRF